MADLSAVLRKTIDALPSATPQLRAKVYEKARAAIQRQIAAADPPLSDELIEARQNALEDAIARTEAHYSGGAPAAEAPAATPPQPSASASQPRVSQPVPPPPRASEPTSAAPARQDGPRDDRAPTPPVVPPPVSTHSAEDRTHPGERAEAPSLRPAARDTRPVPPVAEPEENRIGEIGPVTHQAEPVAARTPAPVAGDVGDHEAHADQIPKADMAAPNYARSRSRRRSSAPLYTGIAALLFIGALGAVGYFYGEEISQALTGTEVAAVDPSTSGTEPEAEAPGAPAAPETASTPPAPDPSQREYTQRLLADGSEVDEGPAPGAPNAFDEGTDVSAASPVLAPGITQPGAEQSAAATPAPEAPAGDQSALPVGQRAVFYEERSGDRDGAQHGGNVVWSLVNEPPTAGQPPEPAIRAVADVTDSNLTMTMTIRRNADETLPASHVIEILFNTPQNFPGGQIDNVQRLALKPTEQARGEPLIGVAGKISDGFFIIALNDLQQAVDNNTALMRDEQWIDIPMAYSSGQRALMSLEKGTPGERVFNEALDAWASRS
ncbi:hypothetical protein [Aureimonas mangrovi]|uniref:hypothetical protein n=1 Tax=Aureimonas mangrovi TaxID=2758041 RepID=UPI00163DDE15|nr:hypothetical protein [Aureimonas mangrovi]